MGNIVEQDLLVEGIKSTNVVRFKLLLSRLGTPANICGAGAKPSGTRQHHSKSKSPTATLIMAAVGPNLAVTRDGARYNKLTRPDDFIAGLAAPNPDIEEAPVSAPRKTTESTKRTLDEADNGDGSEGEESRKRTRIARGTVNSKSRSKARQPLDMDYGMHSMFPGMVDDGDMSDESTNEALAYLRSVRYATSPLHRRLSR